MASGSHHSRSQGLKEQRTTKDQILGERELQAQGADGMAGQVATGPTQKGDESFGLEVPSARSLLVT